MPPASPDCSFRISSSDSAPATIDSSSAIVRCAVIRDRAERSDRQYAPAILFCAHVDSLTKEPFDSYAIFTTTNASASVRTIAGADCVIVCVTAGSPVVVQTFDSASLRKYPLSARLRPELRHKCGARGFCVAKDHRVIRHITRFSVCYRVEVLPFVDKQRSVAVVAFKADNVAGFSARPRAGCLSHGAYPVPSRIFKTLQLLPCFTIHDDHVNRTGGEVRVGFNIVARVIRFRVLSRRAVEPDW